MKLLLALGLVALVQVAIGQNVTLKYANVISALREISDPDVIPIEDLNPKAVELELEQSLLLVVNIDHETEVVEIVVKQIYKWWNKVLTWDPKSPETNVESVTLPIRYMWVPDTIVSSSVRPEELLTPELAVVTYNGEVRYEKQVRLTLQNNLNGLKSPAGANITFTYESWTYDNTQLTLKTPSSTSFIADDFESRQYRVLSTSVTKQVNKYPPNNEPIDVFVYSFNLQQL